MLQNLHFTVLFHFYSQSCELEIKNQNGFFMEHIRVTTFSRKKLKKVLRKEIAWNDEKTLCCFSISNILLWYLEVVARRCSARKGVLRPQAWNFDKKRLWHRCFPVNFRKFLRTSFLTEHFRAAASGYFKGH